MLQSERSCVILRTFQLLTPRSQNPKSGTHILVVICDLGPRGFSPSLRLILITLPLPAFSLFIQMASLFISVQYALSEKQANDIWYLFIFILLPTLCLLFVTYIALFTPDDTLAQR